MLKPTLSPKQYLIIMAVMIIVVSLLIHFVSTWWQSRQAVRNSVKPIAAKVESTAGINRDAEEADKDAGKVEQKVSQGREVYHTIYKEAKNNEPKVADRASAAVPASVRRAFRERRLARERSGQLGEQRGEGSEEN